MTEEPTETAAAPHEGPVEPPTANRGGRLRRLFTPYLSRTGMVLTLTLVTYLISSPRGTFPVARIAAVGALLLVPWLVSDRRWRVGVLGVLFVLAAAGPLSSPLLDLDNHHYLKLYWLLALLLTGMTSDPVAALRRTARWLIGLVFVFATVWKLLVPDFVDGSLLTYLLTTDGNMDRVLVAVGWHEADRTIENRHEIVGLRHDPTVPLEPTELDMPSRSVAVAPALAIATVLLEGAVAVAYLLPLRGRWERLQEISLFTFLVVTYGLLPVFGFGGLLAAMGLAASGLRDRPAILVHLAMWATVGGLTIVADLL